jgi:hypothetical protein
MSIASEAGVKAFIDGFPNQPQKIIGKPTFLFKSYSRTLKKTPRLFHAPLVAVHTDTLELSCHPPHTQPSPQLSSSR